MPARQLDITTTKSGAQSFDRSDQNPRRVTNLKGLCWLTRDAFFQWVDVNPFQMGAALAYFTLFSMAPVLLIAIAVAGLVFGREASQNQIIGLIEDVVGAQSAGAILAIIESAGQTPDSGFFATVIGMIFLLLGAAGVVGQLQDSLNTIWRVVPKTGRGIIGFLQDRLVSYSMVLSVGFLVACLIGPQRALKRGVANIRRISADRSGDGAHTRYRHLVCVYHIALCGNLQIRA